MAAPISVEFELAGSKLPEILGLRGLRARALAYTSVFVVLGALLLVNGVANGPRSEITGGIVFLALGVLAGFVTARAPSTVQDRVKRLVGATKVEFSDQGVQYVGARVTERIDWAQVASVNDRPMAWVLVARPAGTFIIPKSAVRADQAEAFVSQLMDWAGPKYKFRKR